MAHSQGFGCSVKLLVLFVVQEPVPVVVDEAVQGLEEHVGISLEDHVRRGQEEAVFVEALDEEVQLWSEGAAVEQNRLLDEKPAELAEGYERDTHPVEKYHINHLF